MTDIVERLRNRDANIAEIDRMLDEAANEIERLKREYPYSELDMDMHVKAMTKDLRDEIEQLRAALQMAEGCSSLATIGVDAHAIAIEAHKKTMAKLVAAEAEIERLKRKIEQLRAEIELVSK